MTSVRAFASVSHKVAALYVEKNGSYFGLEAVDPWDEERDARLYAGPHPVVAHPPCNRWAKPMAFVNQTRYGHKVGDDGGCFEHALWAVRTFGGVLEHPAHSAAWDAFALPKPARGGWASSLDDPGYTTMIDQWAYGHPCEKRTWLYYVGPEPPELDWRVAPEGVLPVVSWLRGAAWHREHGRKAITRAEASKTPEAFRDALIAMAYGCHKVEAAA